MGSPAGLGAGYQGCLVPEHGGCGVTTPLRGAQGPRARRTSKGGRFKAGAWRPVGMLSLPHFLTSL